MGKIQKNVISLHVNNQVYDLVATPNKTLLEILREELKLTGTKHGCELGECGACTVIVDSQPVLSCLTLAIECAGKKIITVEGLSTGNKLHPLQEAFADLGAAQCGYCTSGMLCTLKTFLDENPDPSREEIKGAISGNLCRCTGYLKILEAAELVAKQMSDAHGCASPGAPGWEKRWGKGAVHA